jgi:hypothetical protein
MRGIYWTMSAAIGALALTGQAAHAGMPVTSTLSATYYEVPDAAHDPDFNTGTFPTVAMGSTLGPNGLPVATGVHDLDASGEITWWDPTLNGNVTQTGTGTITLPYSSNMFPPNSTGGNDQTDFETAVFKGKFDLASSGTVTFDLGSDDDSFIYVDGALFGQNPGVHGLSSVSFTSPTLAAGSHNIEVFYADRENVAAAFSLDLSTTGVVVTPGIPEPATWAMMLIGFGGMGAAMRRTRQRRLAATA